MPGIKEKDIELEKLIKECKLWNGDIVEYDICHSSIFIDFPGKYRYLGHGVIYRINGVLQEGKNEYYFWRYRK